MVMGDLINQQKMFMNFWTSLKFLIILFLSCFLMDSKSISYLEIQISLLMSCLSWAFLALHHFDWLSNLIKHPSAPVFSSLQNSLFHSYNDSEWCFSFLSQPSKHLSATLLTSAGALVWLSLSFGSPSPPSESCWWAFSRGSCFLYWFVRF